MKNWRRNFTDYVVPFFMPSLLRQYHANNSVSMTQAAPWIATQYRGAVRFQGMMPPQHYGVLVTPQTILRGVLPLDYMETMQDRHDSLNLT